MYMTIFKCEYCDYQTDRKNTLMRHLNKQNKCYEKKDIITSKELLNGIITQNVINVVKLPNCDTIETQKEKYTISLDILNCIFFEIYFYFF